MDYYKYDKHKITEIYILSWVAEIAQEIREDFPDASNQEIAKFLCEHANRKLWVHSVTDSQLNSWMDLVTEEATRILET